jgi:hypothetical protein
MSTRTAAEITAKQSTAGSLRQRRPANEEIAARAYELFLLRGSSHGSDLQDWFQAEQELAQKN